MLRSFFSLAMTTGGLGAAPAIALGGGQGATFRHRKDWQFQLNRHFHRTEKVHGRSSVV